MEWKLYPKAPEEFLKGFPEYSPPILQLLWNRGIKTQEEIEDFFYPDYKNLHNPFLMKGVNEIVKEIYKNLKKKNKIGIFTDFDVDGITGAAIFIDSLLELGFPKKLISLYIPNREEEGYGINENGVKFLAGEGAKIFVAIDCGISNIEEIELAKKLGMKTIIIDHHEIPKKLPKADLIIDPLQKGDKYKFKDLAAAGIVFKIAQALMSRKVGKPGSQEAKDFEKQLLDFVCLATIADCCPLLGENRILVKFGLPILQNTKRTGLKEILRLCRLEGSVLSVFDVSYKLAPLLNAASRMDHASTAYKLITTDSIFEAAYLAKKLDRKNRERQLASKKIFAEIDARISAYKRIPEIIVEGDKKWPLTLAGPVAAKVLEKYSRPAVVFKIGEEVSQSSSRSVPGFDMVKVFEQCSQYLEKFGGHPLAAGCTVLNKNFEELKICLERVAKEELKKENLVSILEIDAELNPIYLNFNFFNEVQKFAPFGPKNQKPIFLMKNLGIEDKKMVGSGKNHLKLLFKLDNKRFVEGVLFGAKNSFEGLKEGDKVDVAFELEEDGWNGYHELLLKIIDIKSNLCKN